MTLRQSFQHSKALSRFVVLIAMVFSVVPQLNAKLLVTPHGLKDLKDASPEFSQPFERSVVNTDNGVVVTYRLNYLEATPAQEGYRLSLPGFYDVSTAGSPALLRRKDMFECPHESAPTLKISRVSHTDVNLRLAPSQPLVFDNGTSTFPFETPIKSYGGFLPEKYVDGLSHQKSRHQSVVWVDVFPFSYSTNDSTLRLCTEITYEIAFNTPSSLPPGLTLPGLTLPDTSSVKPQINPNPETDAVMFERADESFLIITVDEFAKSESLQNFATWKRIQGYQTEILSGSSWTPDKIQDKIRTRYQNDPNLNYILIVGDNSLVPARRTSFFAFNDKFLTDKYYACMDGTDDELPDICRGRWPVSSLDELNTIVSKTMMYEANPPEDKEFYSRATHLSYYQKSGENAQDEYRFVRTSEEILTHMEEKFGISVDRLYSSKPEMDKNGNIISYNGPQIFNDIRSKNECRVDSFPGLKGYVWNKGYSQFVDCLKDGRLYTLYTGHGELDHWINQFYSDPVYGDSFTSQNVRSLAENLNTSVLFSIACQTGNFDTDCFANAWLTSKGGSTAVIAQSYDSLSGGNDILAVELFNRWWGGEPIKSDLKNYNPSVKWKRQSRIGCFLDSTLINMVVCEWDRDNHFDDKRAIYASSITHCFADPSMVIHSSYPKKIEEVDVTRDSSKVSVYTGSFIGYISLYDMKTQDTRRFYGNHGFINTDNPESVCIHIEEDGYRPYLELGTIETEEPSEELSPNRIVNITDNLDGTITIHYVSDETMGKPSFMVFNILTEDLLAHTPDLPKGEGKYSINLNPGNYVIAMLINGQSEITDHQSVIVK